MAEIKFGEGAFHLATPVASAGTINVSAVSEHFIPVSGTATITAITMSNYDWKVFIATGAFNITHNGTTLSCPNNASMTTIAAGDTFEARADGSANVTISRWIRFSGKPVVNPTLAELGATSGTITPTFSFATPGDLSVSYATQTGFYYVIGNLCFVTMTLICTPTYTTASGAILIGGLPFTANATYGAVLGIGSTATGLVWPASRTQITSRVGPGTTNITLYGMGSSISTTSLTTTALLTGTAVTLIISGVYVL